MRASGNCHSLHHLRPNLAHRADENVPVSQITAAAEVLRAYLTGRPPQR
jgi:acetylornithine deacetylase/succinyl-diaminopimelate desuccinylase-like protein